MAADLVSLMKIKQTMRILSYALTSIKFKHNYWISLNYTWAKKTVSRTRDPNHPTQHPVAHFNYRADAKKKNLSPSLNKRRKSTDDNPMHASQQPAYRTTGEDALNQDVLLPPEIMNTATMNLVYYWRIQVRTWLELVRTGGPVWHGSSSSSSL
jgi:hypothetical protein